MESFSLHFFHGHFLNSKQNDHIYSVKKNDATFVNKNHKAYFLFISRMYTVLKSWNGNVLQFKWKAYNCSVPLENIWAKNSDRIFSERIVMRVFNKIALSFFHRPVINRFFKRHVLLYFRLRVIIIIMYKRSILYGHRIVDLSALAKKMSRWYNMPK